MSDSSALIDDISDTARWVAMYRAIESARPDALFKDPFAELLAGQRGREILRALPRAGASAAVFAVRVRAMDDLLLDTITSQGVDVVLSLAAGLDARPFRLALPAQLRWIDIDFGPILKHKSQVLAAERPHCQYESIALDLSDVDARRALFTQLGSEARNALVLSEGFLIYLSHAQVADLASDLHAQPAFRWWLTDILSPIVLRLLRRAWNPLLSRGDAHLQFALRDAAPFFGQLGWRVALQKNYFAEARRLGREAWYARLLNPLRPILPPAVRHALERTGGYVVLERA